MKKTLVIALALVLVVAMSVAGTFAYLTAKTEVVSNTFVAGGYVKNETLKLKEHNAVPETLSGKYTLGDKLVNENEYTVVPGADIPKDPFVTVDFKDAAPIESYLYVEIVDNTKGVIGYTVANGWKELEGVTGPNGGAVYAYNTNVTGNLTASVLGGDHVTVAGDADVSGLDTGKTLDFYAYMTQAIGKKDAIFTSEFLHKP